MMPPRESNLFRKEMAPYAVQEDESGVSLRDRIAELESRNQYLQSLVVELLDKNEQLRRKVVQQESLLSSNPHS
jgi:hypothetical protein